jgi:nucleotide-binding universal stress UspA family protein
VYYNVMVGIDGHPGGVDAATLAHQLAAPSARFTLVYVTITAPVATHVTNLELELADLESLPALMAPELEICGDRAQAVRVRASSIGAGLEDTAERHDADLVVVGGSRRHGLTRLISGDDVKSVLHRTRSAVAIAPTGYSEHSARLARIGIAFDERPTSLVALAHGGLLAEQLHGDLRVFGVVEPRYYPVGASMAPILFDDPASELTAARRRYGHVDGLEVQLVYGQRYEELERFSQQIDLLVCGSRHQGPAGRLMLGSTSNHLARDARIPLLIAPASDSAAVERWHAHRKALPV